MDLCAGSPAVVNTSANINGLDLIEVNLAENQYSSSAATTALNNPLTAVKQTSLDLQLLEQVNKLNLDRLKQ